MEFILIFTDGSTEPIEAEDFEEAWVAGKIKAAELKKHLLRIREK